ncbi:signal recognition particle-docking protein FtsY [Candidatus Pacearchaeota archaeon]|nr:signal recognition particle-docking protein FtsY [Candidatus Pacearchaeota archaeon]
MFKFLKEKLSGWFGKKEEPEKKKSSVSKSAHPARDHAPQHAEKYSSPNRSPALKGKQKKIKEKKPVEEKLKKKTGKIKKEKRGESKGAEEKIIEEEFKREKVDARAEELEEEIEEKEIEWAKEKDEPLKKWEVKEEVEKVLREDRPDVAVPEKMGFFGFLARKLTTSELNEEDFNAGFDELEMTLLENNVALGVVDKIREGLKKELVGKRYGKKEVEGKILSALKKSIDVLLIEPPNLIEQIRAKKDSPFVILFFGINGSGKTTSIAKLAWKLKKLGLEPVLAAGDTFRAASIEQLETHAQKIGVEIVKGEYGKDPASVAFDAIAYAKKNHKKVVLIDTAGRMYTKQNLMKEMEKIVKVSKPDLKIFVGESITGNDATEQARMFEETAGIDGIILSKADVDEKAGTILSVSFVTGKPIYFLGVGQEYGDLQEFSKKSVLKGLGLE